VLEGSCAAYAPGTPYCAFAQVLKGYCRIHDADSSEDMRGKVAGSVLPGAGDPALLLPALFDVLGVLPAEDAWRAIDPALRRRRTHDALRQFVLAASAAQPLCLIVGDLQWVDVEAREVLDGLVNGMARSRLLLAVNYRPEFQHAWGHKSNYRQVHLDALSEQDAAGMLDALLGVDPGLAPLKRSLAGHGNPFYFEEIRARSSKPERCKARAATTGWCARSVRRRFRRRCRPSSPRASTGWHSKTGGCCRSHRRSTRTCRSRCCR